MHFIHGRVQRLKLMYLVWSQPTTVYDEIRLKSPYLGIGYVLILLDHAIHKIVLLRVKRNKD